MPTLSKMLHYFQSGKNHRYALRTYHILSDLATVAQEQSLGKSPSVG